MNERDLAQWATLQRQLARFLIEPDRHGNRADVISVLEPGDFGNGPHGPLLTLFMHADQLTRENPAWTATDLLVSLVGEDLDAEHAIDDLFRSEIPPLTVDHTRRLVVEMVTMRQRRQMHTEVSAAALRGIDDPYAAAQMLEAAFGRILDQGVDRWPVYESPFEMSAQRRDDWVLPELLLPGEVFMATASGGAGKSELLRQFAMCAANNLHPFNGRWDEKHGGPSIVLDFETQGHNVKESFIRIGNNLHKRHGFPVDQIRYPRIVSLRQRVNLRSGSDLAELRRILGRVQPRLVCVGPLKNLYAERDGESYSNAALDLQDVLMRIMSDYDCAVAIEAHGTKADTGSTAGSQRWADWPDVAVGLEPITEDEVRKAFASREGADLLHQFLNDHRNDTAIAAIRLIPRRGNRNSEARVPRALVRSPDFVLPWMSFYDRVQPTPPAAEEEPF